MAKIDGSSAAPHPPNRAGPADTEIAIAAWTDIPVQLTGEIVDGVFTVSSAASA